MNDAVGCRNTCNNICRIIDYYFTIFFTDGDVATIYLVKSLSITHYIGFQIANVHMILQIL